MLLDLGQPLCRCGSNEDMLPDIAGLVGGLNPDFLGIVVSHPHLDHYGLLSRVHASTPIYLGEEALRILRASRPFTEFGMDLPGSRTYRDQVPFDLGAFRITPFLVDHSAFDSYSFLIEASGRKIFYSGDFRAHGRKAWTFNRLLEEPRIKGVDVLLVEGTHLSRNPASAKTESALEDDIVSAISKTPGIVLACFSPQNIDRFVTFWKAAGRSGRTFVADAYLANILHALNRPSLPKPQVFLPKGMRTKLIRDNEAAIVNPFYSRRIYPETIQERANELVLLFRPTMISELKALKCLTEGRLIYSQWPCYLERDNHRLKNFCAQQGIVFEVLHTSGHADVPTLVGLIGAIDARRVIPVHTDAPERLGDLVHNCTLVENSWIEC